MKKNTIKKFHKIQWHSSKNQVNLSYIYEIIILPN